MEWAVVGVVVVVVLIGLVVVRRRRLEAEQHSRTERPGADRRADDDRG
jgi:hypothetical protein